MMGFHMQSDRKRSLAGAALGRALVFAVPVVFDSFFGPHDWAAVLASALLSSLVGSLLVFDRSALGAEEWARGHSFGISRPVLHGAAIAACFMLYAAPGSPKHSLALLGGIVIGFGLNGSNDESEPVQSAMDT
jgi:hypothetical protein